MTSLQLVDFLSISPFIILLISALILILIESFNSVAAKKIAFLTTVITMIAAIEAVIYAPKTENLLLTQWLAFDSIYKNFAIFFLVIGLSAAGLSATFFKRFKATQGEYYFLLVSAVFGMLLTAAATDFLMIFIGIETLSLSLYILCAYIKNWKLSTESAIKYFFMGAIAAAFLVYGIGLIYGAVGTTQLAYLLQDYQSLQFTQEKLFFLLGIALITLGLSFKAAIVPFHFWAPDVYDGAPTPVTAFMAVGTKVCAFVALARVFLVALPSFDLRWNQGVSYLAIITLIYANFVALQQTHLRRFFAYSGIAQAGFLLIPFIVSGQESIQALFFYLVIYACATFGCFAVISLLDHQEEGVSFNQLKGLFKRSPYLASIFSFCLLTLSGLPPLAGFFAKFYVFKLAFQAHYYALVVIGLLTTILSAYYYLRMIAWMFLDASDDVKTVKPEINALTIGTLSCLSIVIFTLYPQLIFQVVALIKF